MHPKVLEAVTELRKKLTRVKPMPQYIWDCVALAAATQKALDAETCRRLPLAGIGPGCDLIALCRREFSAAIEKE